jgi:hypothetical protein
MCCSLPLRRAAAHHHHYLDSGAARSQSASTQTRKICGRAIILTHPTTLHVHSRGAGTLGTEPLHTLQQ